MVEREDNLLCSTCGQMTKQVKLKTFEEKESRIESYNFSKGDKPDVINDEIQLIA